MRSKLFLSILFLLASFSQKAKAQYSQHLVLKERVLMESIVVPTFRPERPSSIKSSLTVLPKYLYLETGLGYQSDNFVDILSIGQLKIRTGITSRLEGSFGVNSYLVSEGDSRIEGFDIGLKYNVSGSNYSLDFTDYNLSIYSGFKTSPIGSEGTKKDLKYSFLILADYHFFHPEYSFLTINAGYTEHPILYNANHGVIGLIQYSIPLEFYSIDAPIDLHITYSIFSKRIDDILDQILELGYTFGAWGEWQIDINAGFVLNDQVGSIEVGFVKEFLRLKN